MNVNFGMKARRTIDQAARVIMKPFQRRAGSSSRSDEPLVLAVTHCYPIRVVLYAAAFQGGWHIHFMESLREVLDTANTQRPKAVFYDLTAGDPAWRMYCSSLFRKGIPFLSLAHKRDDETFLNVLAAGGFQVCGEPLTSEEILNAVEFAEEVAGMARVSVV